MLTHLVIRIFRVVLMLAVIPLSVSAHTLDSLQQTSVRTLFSEMPDSLFPYLTRNNRLDMLDFLESNMKAEVKNRFDGSSELLLMQDTYLRVQLSSSSTLDMILLPVDEPVDSAHQVVCLLQTFCDRESTVSFYSVNWRQLPTKRYLSIPMKSMSGSWNHVTQTLVLTSDTSVERIAIEGQKPVEKTLTNLTWTNRFRKKH